ncbi:MAG: UvrD-helicase domain-containing protein, partial [Aquificae bacterium]|nr:UvrD-helicase domain-containing protein [Aquificota bacterium]
MADYLEHLNDKQKEAVLYFNSPLLVLAGAGSGKTRVITYKILYMIDKLNIPIDRILAITFTNKAAEEMKERVSTVLGLE